MASINLVRPAPADSADSSSKRRKLYDSNDDSGDELFDGYQEESLPQHATIPTQPLNGGNTQQQQLNHIATSMTPTKPSLNTYSNIPTQPLVPASPHSFATQPTQMLPAGAIWDSAPLTPRHPPVLQVPASSPFQSNYNQHSSPPRPFPPMQARPPLQPDGTIRPFEFYPPKPNTKPIQLNNDGPHYIGSDSEDDASQHAVRPAFGGSAAKRPVPSVSLIRGRTTQDDRAPQSPIMGANFSRFAYNPSAKKPAAAGRLDSLSRRPPTMPGSASILQRRAEPAMPVPDITLEQIGNMEYRQTVARMKAVFPQRTLGVLLKTLLDNKGVYDDAVEALLNATVDLTDDNGGAEEENARVALKTANRGAGAGKVAIRDKWSTAQALRRDPASSPPPPAAAAPARKRKLVRGSNRNSAERSESPAAPIMIDDSDDSEAESEQDSDEEHMLEGKVLKYINVCSTKELADIACTSEETAETIISRRPYSSIDEIRQVSTTTAAVGKKKGRSKPIGDKVIDVCLETMRGYDAVDTLINKVEQLGKPIAESIKAWGVDVHTGSGTGELEMTDITVDSDSGSAKDSGIGTPTDDGELDIKGTKRVKSSGAFKEQPKNMKEGIQLKDYQLAGVNWLNLLYEKRLSCILADEMGLGKTCQVIAFFAHLLTKGIKGPHLVVVPSSTLENWLREFANFCPELKVEPYYGNQKERPSMRESLRRDRSWNVLVTTYQLATGDRNDRGFLKGLDFNCCVYDEGHLLKNGASNRYDALIKLPAKFRLLLTGTPLQNNLQELASLLAFILPEVFSEKRADLASIFKYKAKTTGDEESNNALLSQQRIRRARAMMTPFVLRRKKAQVLKHLPTKTSRVEFCTLNKTQAKIYHEQIANAKESIEARAQGKKPNKSTSNVMMQLRKAAIHPLLFRSNYPDDKLRKMARDIMKEDAYRHNDQQAIYEDMEVMNDLELSRLCQTFPKTIGKYALKKKEWMDSGKVEALERMLVEMKEAGDRVLVFSQFTQMLDILELVLTTLDMGYLRIDGSTPVEARQDLIDQYHTETDIMVFLLSTKAGGFGINLACANKVIIFDSSFNPHDDAQASDRAHRVGQTRDVEVIRLVTKNTIEEQILQLANTKLALDQSVSGEGDEKAIEGKGEQLVAKMMLEKLEEQVE